MINSNLQLYPPKASSFHSEGELSGSYVSIECPSPPAPPVCITDVRRDPQVNVMRKEQRNEKLIFFVFFFLGQIE